MAKKIVKLTESDINRLVKKVINEDSLEGEMANIQTMPAAHFIETLYEISEKNPQMKVCLTFDGKYLVAEIPYGTKPAKFKITIT